MARIKRIFRHAEATYVVTNNHNLGKAIVNAFELEAFLSGWPVPAPEKSGFPLSGAEATRSSFGVSRAPNAGTEDCLVITSNAISAGGTSAEVPTSMS